MGQLDQRRVAVYVRLDEALRLRADWHVDQLAHLDQVRVGDVGGVGGDERLERDVELVLGDACEGVAGDDRVEAQAAGDAGRGGRGGVDQAGRVVRVADLGRDGEDLVCEEDVYVGDGVGPGDVADAPVKSVGDSDESVVGLDGIGRAGGVEDDGVVAD